MIRNWPAAQSNALIETQQQSPDLAAAAASAAAAIKFQAAIKASKASKRFLGISSSKTEQLLLERLNQVLLARLDVLLFPSVFFYSCT